jgi:hypothetical protein
MAHCLSLLVVGDLGPVGLQSLSSMAVLDLHKICVISDDLGEAWLVQNVPDIHKEKLCFHSNPDISTILQRFENNTYYAGFGTNKFIEIMVLKWLLLLDIFRKHPLFQFVIYSDLDVIWATSPTEEVQVFLNSAKPFAIQEDFNNKTGRIFYCPGIMFWRNSTVSRDILKELVGIHNNSSSIGTPMPDDKVLNGLIVSKNLFLNLHVLPRNQFVIGHRIIDLVAQIRGFKLEDIICYHANYSTSERIKLSRMSASLLSKSQISKRSKFLFISMVRRYLR